MSLQESGEMYLESILALSRKKGQVRSIDIADHMGFSKPSVSRAVGLLKSGGYIEVDKHGFITLTDIGTEVAEKIFDRHKTLTQILVRLGVSEEVAIADACKIEHAISDESFKALKKYISESF